MSTRCARTVTQMDNMLFSNMTLNPQPLHIDREFCEKETEWGQPLMNSLFTLGLMIGIQVSDMTVGTTIANLGMTDVKFPNPLFEGDTVNCATTVISQARVEIAAQCRHRRIPSQGVQAGRQAGRRMPPPGVHAHAPGEVMTMMRSLLFVPADSPRKLEKGMTSGADALIVDLEDSIAPERKVAARAPALAFLKEAGSAKTRPRLLVRINSLDTGLADADLDAVVGGRPDAILLPKAEGGAAVTHLDAKLTAREAIAGLPEGGIGIYALTTETAKALFLAGTYGGSSRRLNGMTWGAEDLSAELGADANRDRDGNWLDPYRVARTLCLAGASAAQVPASTQSMSITRTTRGSRECEEARRDGFTGKLAIHPGQVAAINEVFTPSGTQIARAKAVVAAFAAQPGAGTVGIEGRMYDRPHLVRANALLASVKAKA